VTCPVLLQVFTGRCLVGSGFQPWYISILIIPCNEVVGMDIAQAIREIEAQVGRISPVQKFLLGTDRSVTQILESIAGKKVVIRTLVQKVMPADRAAADNLSIAEGDPVNFRIVEIRTEKSGEVLIYAISHTPINRLSPAFCDDLMKADIPLGRIIKQHLSRPEGDPECPGFPGNRGGRQTVFYL
jgi:chorismate-pyruvate lyase